MRLSESLTKFLTAQDHHDPSLIDRWSIDMETQVNVAAGDGEPVADKRSTYTDGVNEWWSIRIPKNAHSEPEFRDYNMTWPLDLHAEAIGSTGWNWKLRCSRWVGYDFDTITGHAAGIGITDVQLREVQDAAAGVPWVEVRKSTGGRGIHLYVLLDCVPTNNHNEHAALARAVLAMLSAEAGFDFASQVDACGGNMWIWHRKAWAAGGLAMIKPSEQVLSEDDLPANWRDHLDVVTRKRSKVRLKAVADEEADTFEQLASARPHCPLDEDHRAVIEALMESGFSTLWIADYGLLQTHTVALKRVHTAMGLDGLFETSSGGNDPGSPNCFCFPEPDGRWSVYRFSPGIVEHPLWKQDGHDWTYCAFNRKPDLETACRAFGGIEDGERGLFNFRSTDAAVEAAKALGIDVNFPPLAGHDIQFKVLKDGRFAVDVVGREVDGMEAWVRKKGKYHRTFGRVVEKSDNHQDYDSWVRKLVLPNGEGGGWALKTKMDWIQMPKDDAKSYLLHMGHSRPEVDQILGGAIVDPWQLVSLPFQPEYPGDRRWNLGAPQFRFTPAEEDGPHPHWDMILRHCFQDLTASLKTDDWAKEQSVKTGADFGLMWIACLLREPFEPLPYLFLYGDQNSGKSILHEAIGTLITSGVCSADRALSASNNQEFNGELEHAVLAVVEERHFGSDGGDATYNRIKDLVTSKTLWIRKMRTDAYPQPNTLHFVHCSNDKDACPLKPGDTRITMLHVPPPETDIPKPTLIARLKEEAPYFLRTLLDLTLPSPCGRMRLPAITTAGKASAEAHSADDLHQFILECTEEIEGTKVVFMEFYDRFVQWLDVDARSHWSKRKVSGKLPAKHTTMRGTDNKVVIPNMKWRDNVD